MRKEQGNQSGGMDLSVKTKVNPVLLNPSLERPQWDAEGIRYKRLNPVTDRQ